jgi:uncharacterized Zn-binding protein involved in type VI secretion
MAFAAQSGSQTAHPGAVTGPSVPTVLIEGMPAAVMGDNHACGFPSGNPPSPLANGSPTVLIGGQPAARVGDSAGCGASIVTGALTVEVG